MQISGVVAQIIPTDELEGHALDTDEPDDGLQAYNRRPNFTLPTMSNNFRRFNARIGVVFKFQVRMIRLFSWRRPTHTLSFLAVYTFVCLDPYLLVVLLRSSTAYSASSCRRSSRGIQAPSGQRS